MIYFRLLLLSIFCLAFQKSGFSQFGTQQIISNNTAQPTYVASKDFNNDGYSDVISVTYPISEVSLSLNQGDGTFSAPIIIDTLGGTAHDIAVGDYNQDGNYDLAISANANTYILEGTGGGNFVTTNIIPFSFVQLQASDFDNDNLLDIMAVKYGGGIHFLKNLGGSTFYDSTMTVGFFQDVFGSSFADFDNDGDLDVVTSDYDDQTISWHENVGTSAFLGISIIHQIPSNNDFIRVNTGDIDGDGFVDILTYEKNSGGPMSWYKNLGNGMFSTEQVISTSGEKRRVKLIDLDNDGDLDIIYGRTNTISMMTNDGTGQFGSIQVISYLTVNGNDVALSDTDNDGDLDLFAASYGDDKVSYYENYNFHSENVSGKIFADLNQNNILDSTDLGLNNIQILSSPQSDMTYTYQDGNYFMNFSSSPGAYTIFNGGLQGWSLVTDSINYTVVIDSVFTNVDSLDFGFYPDSIYTSTNPQLTGGYPKCNTIVNYWSSIENIGTTSPSLLVHLLLDDSLSYVGADILPDSVIGQNVYWHLDSVNYFSMSNINAQIQMPDFNSFGDQVLSVLNVCEIDSFGNVLSNFYDTLQQTITCAYDPNDKLNNPAGYDDLGYLNMETDKMEYTIRFQNTGNDTAAVVQIVDQLDTNFNWSSLTILASSHTVQTFVDQSGEVSFLFESIMLPDSNVNFLGSQGYVKYSIDLNPNTPSGTSFFNQADIYFDWNPAVLTNTTVNTLYECNSVWSNFELSDTSEVCLQSIILFEGDIDSTSYFWNIGSVANDSGNDFEWVADTSGTFDVSISASNFMCNMDTNFTVFAPVNVPTQIIQTSQICSGDSVNVFGTFYTQSGIYHDSLISQYGCDSIVGHQVSLMPIIPVAVVVTTNICYGDSILVFGQTASMSGIYYDTLQGALSCDSVIGHEVIVLPEAPVNLIDTTVICSGDSLMIFGGFRSLSGIYYDTLQGVFSCDSIVAKVLEVSPPLIVEFIAPQDTVCINAALINLSSGIPSGGVYIGQGVTGGAFYPANAGQGTHQLFYEYTDTLGCSAIDSASIFVDGCAGLSDYEIGGIEVYPNPFTNYTTIIFPKEKVGNHDVLIYDAVGRLVFSKTEVHEKEFKIYKDELSSGVYRLMIYSESGSNILWNQVLIVE